MKRLLIALIAVFCTGLTFTSCVTTGSNDPSTGGSSTTEVSQSDRLGKDTKSSLPPWLDLRYEESSIRLPFSVDVPITLNRSGLRKNAEGIMTIRGDVSNIKLSAEKDNPNYEAWKAAEDDRKKYSELIFNQLLEPVLKPDEDALAKLEKERQAFNLWMFQAKTYLLGELDTTKEDRESLKNELTNKFPKFPKAPGGDEKDPEWVKAKIDRDRLNAYTSIKSFLDLLLQPNDGEMDAHAFNESQKKKVPKNAGIDVQAEPFPLDEFFSPETQEKMKTVLMFKAKSDLLKLLEAEKAKYESRKINLWISLSFKFGLSSGLFFEKTPDKRLFFNEQEFDAKTKEWEASKAERDEWSGLGAAIILVSTVEPFLKPTQAEEDDFSKSVKELGDLGKRLTELGMTFSDPKTYQNDLYQKLKKKNLADKKERDGLAGELEGKFGPLGVFIPQQKEIQEFESLQINNVEITTVKLSNTSKSEERLFRLAVNWYIHNTYMEGADSKTLTKKEFDENGWTQKIVEGIKDVEKLLATQLGKGLEDLKN